MKNYVEMKKILFVSVLGICVLSAGCRDSAKNYPVTFVDRRAALAPGKQPNPLTLVVRIDENGKLALNRIETGRIEDPSELTEKIKAVFADREKASIREREVVIDPQGDVKREDLERLVENLESVKAAPVRVIKSDLQITDLQN